MGLLLARFMTLACKVSKDRNMGQLYLLYDWAHAGRPGTELLGALPSSAEELHDIPDWLGCVRSQWQKYKINCVSQCRVCSYTIPITLDINFSLQIIQIFNFCLLHSNAFLLLGILDQDKAILISFFLVSQINQKFNSLHGSCCVFFLMRKYYDSKSFIPSK